MQWAREDLRLFRRAEGGNPLVILRLADGNAVHRIGGAVAIQGFHTLTALGDPVLAQRLGEDGHGAIRQQERAADGVVDVVDLVAAFVCGARVKAFGVRVARLVVEQPSQRIEQRGLAGAVAAVDACVLPVRRKDDVASTFEIDQLQFQQSHIFFILSRRFALDFCERML